MARKKKGNAPRPKTGPVKAKSNNRLAKVSAFLVGSGILMAILGATYQYFAGNVSLAFVQSVGRAYEFQLTNDTPSDRTVTSFRIIPPDVQQVIYKVTEDVYATRDEKGQITLPGGNQSYVPAAEFKELDGQRLSANASFKFRVPPLSNRTWMAPEAAIVDIRYEIDSSNPVLAAIEGIFDVLGFHSRQHTVRYLVIENYWTPSRSNSLNEAIRIFCRDSDTVAKSSSCANF
ncbi:hypothetical protein OI978_23550 [Serratia nevei]|uniref:hypothetical protein n=1 Tax=Serratia nevei TaxID=2703794 RepID=UPI002542E405|nr:hypothetical protein [Serratia nevei]EMB4113389.1 hypothetical protein [Serratia marcescens]EMB4114771.1 hypothetical protein [Serratia marcescens]WIJ63752.1 hypothetical protein OI978_23550 [Serratia nevei]